MKSKLPPISQEPVQYVDATPDDGYPLRILRAHRQHADCNWVVSGIEEGERVLYDMMNGMNHERAQILDEAISVLERHYGRQE